MSLSRRLFLTSSAGALSAPALLRAQPLQFSRYTVVDYAQRLASQPYDPSVDHLPTPLANLSYDEYRKIRMRPQARLPLGEGFALDLFHRGHLFPHKVTVHIVRDGTPHEVPYLSRLFDFGGLRLGQLDRSTGFAGLRLRYPLNRPEIVDELGVFLGASYFRFLGRGQRYGTSLRGLGVNAGLPGITEEFPVFREFWIEEAEPEAQHLVVHALLDSPSLTGAFRFVFFPAQESVVDVQSTLIPRVTLERVAIAPITSMFFTGAQDRRLPDAFRPEVHDADGLLIEEGQSKRWRPLRNPPEAQVSTFPISQLTRFGLTQRHRRFDDYQDLEANYELRPGYVIEPTNAWGPGAIVLSELSTEFEIHDNIVASFRPDQKLHAGRPWEFHYRISTHTQTQQALAHVHHALVSPPQIWLDFAGGDLAYWQHALDDLQLQVQAGDVMLTPLPSSWNPHVPGVRAGFSLGHATAPGQMIEAFLSARGKRLSETWTCPAPAVPAAQELAEDRSVR